jgi:MarR family transcriptional regulator, organic hydroperoxide resistance regulator
MYIVRDMISRDMEPDLLRLDGQICFSLYAASRLVTRLYQPLLEPLGLTYPQYVVLMILWEDAPCRVSRVSARAQLNTNTLTPLLKRLEALGYVRRHRSRDDERVVELHLSPSGRALRSRASCVPAQLAASAAAFPLPRALELKGLLDQLIVALTIPKKED